MGLPAAKVMFTKGSDFRMANGIVIRTHGHNMLDIVNHKDGSSHRRHLDHVRFRTDIAQEETKSLLAHRKSKAPTVSHWRWLGTHVHTRCGRSNISDCAVESVCTHSQLKIDKPVHAARPHNSHFRLIECTLSIRIKFPINKVPLAFVAFWLWE